MKTHVYVFLAVLLLTLVALAVSACKLDPSKVPPCTGLEKFPDPCAAGARDAGVGG